MPRFAVLEHHWNGVHWDFMLEDGATLKTWALETAPDVPRSIAARQQADHRLIYLDYEGEISGGRGHVTRWDHGTFEWLRREEDKLTIELSGKLLKGQASLTAGKDGWLFLHNGV